MSVLGLACRCLDERNSADGSSGLVNTLGSLPPPVVRPCRREVGGRWPAPGPRPTAGRTARRPHALLGYILAGSVAMSVAILLVAPLLLAVLT